MATTRSAQQPSMIQLPTAWQVPSGIRERLGTELVGRQRAVIDETLDAGQYSPLLLVLHEVPDRATSRRGLFLWRDVAGIWKVYRQGEAYNNNANGIAALHEHMANYEAEEHALRDAYERAQRAGQYLTILEEAALQSHATTNLHRTLADARTLMRERKIDYDVEIINARDRAYNIEREFDLLYTDTQNALDYREAHAVEILNILFLIFFPLTIIASIFETGIIQQLLDTTPTLDPLVLTISLLVAALLLGIGFYLLITPLQRRSRRGRRRPLVQRTKQFAQPLHADEPSIPNTFDLPTQTPTAQTDRGKRRHPLRFQGRTKPPRTLGKAMTHYQIEEKRE